MQEGEEISTETAGHKYCISWFVMQVCNVGAALFISSWNAHPIPGMFVCHTCVSIIMLKEHTQGFRILYIRCTTNIIIIAANNYVLLRDECTTVQLHGCQSSPGDGKSI